MLGKSDTDLLTLVIEESPSISVIIACSGQQTVKAMDIVKYLAKNSL